MLFKNLDKNIIDLDGNVIKEGFTIGKVVANSIVGDKQKKLDHLRAYELALAFYGKEEIDIIDSDANIVKEIMSTSDTYNALIIGQSIKALEG